MTSCNGISGVARTGGVPPLTAANHLKQTRATYPPNSALARSSSALMYPTVYATQEEFDSVRLPPAWTRFVVIRDLRDTLVSGYFSLRHSHPLHEGVTHWHGALGGLEAVGGGSGALGMGMGGVNTRPAGLAAGKAVGVKRRGGGATFGSAGTIASWNVIAPRDILAAPLRNECRQIRKM